MKRNHLQSGFHPLTLRAILAVIGAGILSLTTPAADHGDRPLLIEAGRHDARLTDLFAFRRGDNLVLILGTNPAIPPSATSYQFPSDVTFEIGIDNDSEVTFDDPEDLARLGGTVEQPRRITEDIVLRLRFDQHGARQLQTRGLSRAEREGIALFTGLRDDPFIRGPRTGRNIAAVVLELPLSRVLDEQDTLLIWARARIDGFEGPNQEIAGRALRSMLPENDDLNAVHPRQHHRKTGLDPDVMIFDTSRAAEFPNGRALEDDVVDLVGDPRVLANDQPFPDENDVPFLDTFPYLAPPHPAL